jgi:methyl-accepting chemotaxis protein
MVERDFIPAMKTRDFALARNILNEELKPTFENHRVKIVQTVAITEKVASETEDEIIHGMDDSMLLLIIISVVMLATLLIVIFSISRSIIRPIKKATVIAKHLSNGNFDKAEQEINNTN